MDRDIVQTKLESLRRCVERIADKSPSSVDELVRDLDLQDIIAAHSYQSINWTVVYHICLHHLDDFRQSAKAVAQRLQ